MHTIAYYYNTTVGMSNLFAKITNQKITNCKECVAPAAPLPCGPWPGGPGVKYLTTRARFEADVQQHSFPPFETPCPR